MILVDFSHLSMRNLYIAIGQVNPNKINGKYENNYMNFFYHLMLNSLIMIRQKFKEYGDIYLIIDSRNNWRKKIYPKYKEQRKNDRDKSLVDFDYFFQKRDAFIKILDKCFPFYVVQVDGCEADDIIVVMAKNAKEKTVVITSDKDLKQVIEFGVEFYDPIKQEFSSLKKEDIEKLKLKHILLGDKSDNIPNIKQETEYSKDFIAYLKQNSIYIITPSKLEKMEIFEKLKNEFLQKNPDKEIYKKTRFGEKTVEKIIKENKLDELLEDDKVKENFERNKKLIDFDLIPNDIENKILDEINTLNMSYDGDCIFKFLTKANLKEIIGKISLLRK